MAEGLEKFTEVPVEFFKDGSAFVRKCQRPDKKGMYIPVVWTGDFILDNREIHIELGYLSLKTHSSKNAVNGYIPHFTISILLFQCTDPEYMKIIRAVGVGFIMMGVVGYAVKLLHIPIRYLIV